jgi:hypothetical protein
MIIFDLSIKREAQRGPRATSSPTASLPPHRDRRRHRGANPEASRFVTCCGNHASLRRVTDRDRSIFEIPVVALLDGGMESVHVNVNDLTNPPLAHSSMLVDLERSETIGFAGTETNVAENASSSLICA